MQRSQLKVAVFLLVPIHHFVELLENNLILTFRAIIRDDFLNPGNQLSGRGEALIRIGLESNIKDAEDPSKPGIFDSGFRKAITHVVMRR